MRMLLSMVVLLALFTGCSKGYKIINKATEHVKKSISVCTEAITSKQAKSITEACENAASKPAEPTHEVNGVAWDARMLLW